MLQGAIRASGNTQTEVDERIGRRRGYLSHVFQRRVDLKLVDLLRCLEVLGIDPRRFFAALSVNSPSANAGVLQLIADRLDEPVDAAEPRAAEAADPALEERVRHALRSILTELGQGEDRRTSSA